MRLAQGVEGQFDTTIVAAFEAILAGADEAYRTGKRLDFTLDAQDVYDERKTQPQAAARSIAEDGQRRAASVRVWTPSFSRT